MQDYDLLQLHLDPAQDRSDMVRDAWLTAALGQIGPALELGLYRHVARIRAQDAEDVFRQTNSIDAPWHLALAESCLIPDPRSTSMGDILIPQDGPALACAALGWEPLRDDQAARARSLRIGLAAEAGPVPGE